VSGCHAATRTADGRRGDRKVGGASTPPARRADGTPRAEGRHGEQMGDSRLDYVGSLVRERLDYVGSFSRLDYTSDSLPDRTPDSTRLFEQRPDVILPALRRAIRHTSRQVIRQAKRTQSDKTPGNLTPAAVMPNLPPLGGGLEVLVGNPNPNGGRLGVAAAAGVTPTAAVLALPPLQGFEFSPTVTQRLFCISSLQNEREVGPAAGLTSNTSLPSNTGEPSGARRKTRPAQRRNH
jgi:hypothetical protein